MNTIVSSTFCPPVARVTAAWLIASILLGLTVGCQLGGTPKPRPDIFLAILGGNENNALEMLTAGADPNARDADQGTPLAYAARFGMTRLVDRLLDAGAQVNARSANGETALMEAANGGHPDIVQLLLNHAADRRVRDAAGWTASDYAQARLRISSGAVRERYEQVVTLLQDE